MKKLRMFLLSLVAIVSTASLFACNDKESSVVYEKDLDSEVRQRVKDIAMNDSLLTGELENCEIKWLSSWDINPDESGKNVPMELAVFQERYNGTIKWYRVDHEQRYEMLAKYINSGEGIDFFPNDDLDAFPKGAIREMFVSADDYVDFETPLWEDVKEVNDSVMWDNQHYMMILSVTGDSCGVVYNRNTIAEAGLDDPAELLKNDEWTWDSFENMLDEFVDPQNQKYGIDGWWFESGFMRTTGVPAIGLKNGELVNNLSNPSMERVQNWLYSLYNNGNIAIGSENYGWTAKPEYIGEGKLLFYPVGLWSLYCEPAQWQAQFGEDMFFVPMPKDPDADEYYIPTGVNSYMFVNGGSNPEGVAKYLDCKRYTLLNDDVRAIADGQMIDDYGWTQEMLDMKEQMEDMAMENPIFEFSNGVSTDVQSILDSNLRASSRGIPWSETFESISATVDNLIAEINDEQK